MNVLLETRDILKRIIDKGGLYGAAAKLYIKDEQKAQLFIKECAGQCHNLSTIKYWGEELVLDIITYSENSRANNYAYG